MARSKATSATPAAPDDAAPFEFEKSMSELEGVVARLEQGDVPLEEALKSFERGIALTRACQQALTQAEQKVELLVARADGSVATVEFDAPDSDDEAE
jgi:exodeoxyribonuclease VII small subunit